MGKPFILYNKALAFSKRIAKMEQYLRDKNTVPYDVVRQVLRSGTSVCANISESLCAESKLDFIHKLKIALKEADEAKGWLLIIQASYTVHEEALASLISDLQEIIYMLVASVKTTKSNMEDCEAQ